MWTIVELKRHFLFIIESLRIAFSYDQRSNVKISFELKIFQGVFVINYNLKIYLKNRFLNNTISVTQGDNGYLSQNDHLGVSLNNLCHIFYKIC